MQVMWIIHILLISEVVGQAARIEVSVALFSLCSRPSIYNNDFIDIK